MDDKGRVSIPAPFRRVLEEGDPDWKSGEQPRFVINYGIQAGRCLEAYSLTGIEEFEAEVKEMPRLSKRRRLLARAIISKSIDAKVDPNGRIILSEDLRSKIGITDRAMFVGMGDKFEIWEPSAYAADENALVEWGGEGSLYDLDDGAEDEA